jgi:excisionase family DNA binding protein
MSDDDTKARPERLAYGVAEAARAAGIGRSTLYEALASGELSARKLGRRTLIPADELRRFLAALPSARAASNAA